MKEITKETANVTHFIPTCEQYNNCQRCLCDTCNVELYFVRYDKDTKTIWIDAREICQYDGEENVGFMKRISIKPEDYRYTFIKDVFEEQIKETD